ncbi:MAG TPA: L,D-transpeptidase [Micromonosporaceae bacterium]
MAERFTAHRGGIDRRRVLGLAGLGAVGAALAACGANPGTPSNPGNLPESPGASGSAAPSPSASPTPVGEPVHVRLYQGDGSTFGVGLPIIAYLSRKITDGRAFAAATKATVNGEPVQGAWYFQNSAIYKDYPIEAHYRLQDYWPGHASIRLELPVEGLSAGPGLVFDNSLTLDAATGAANVSKIDGKTLRMIVTSDGTQVFNFPVSLGKASTPTFSGIKVVMEKNKLQRMVNTTPGQAYDVKVPWSVRITNSGEFIHSASWNGGNIGSRSTSHGCTNLTLSDAEKFFNFAQIGDVTEYTNTGGATMPSWDGYGDWNLPWSTWQLGGIVPTS